MKNTLLFLLAFILVMALATGCGDTKEPATKKSEKPINDNNNLQISALNE